jgi:hypothetical protein
MGGKVHLPCRLEAVGRELELALASSPVARAVIRGDPDADFSGFLLVGRARVLCHVAGLAQGEECAIRVEDRQVAFEVINKVEFHLRQL